MAAAATAAAIAFSPVPATAAAVVEGLSFRTVGEEDILTLRVSEEVQPTISRQGMENRIIVEIPTATPDPSLAKAVSGKRGHCVERIEAQTFRSAGEAGPGAGVRQVISDTDTILVATVEQGVEAETTTVGNIITVRYYRLPGYKPQNRPLPENTLTRAFFDKVGTSEVITFRFSGETQVSVSEGQNPRRLLLNFPNVSVAEQTRETIFKLADDSSTLFTMEVIGTGTIPYPFDNEDTSRETHFVGSPSPFKTTPFVENRYGAQNKGIVFSFTPLSPNIQYTVNRKAHNVYAITFYKKKFDTKLVGTRRVEVCNSPCTQCDPSCNPNSLFPLEDENGATIQYKFDEARKKKKSSSD